MEITPPAQDSNESSTPDLSQLLTIKKAVVFERKRDPKSVITIDDHSSASSTASISQTQVWADVTEGEIWKCPSITEKPKKDDVVAFRVSVANEQPTYIDVFF